MASPQIHRRGDFYEYRIQFMKNGKRHSVSQSGFLKRNQAERAGLRRATEIELGVYTTSSDIKLADYMWKWKKIYKDGTITERTEKGLIRVIKRVESEYNLKLNQITKENYQEYLNSLASTLSKKSVQQHHGYIKKVLKEALQQKLIPDDVTYGIVVKGNQSNTYSEESKYLSKDEFERLSNALYAGINHRYSSRHIILLAMYSGMRFGECLALTFEDLDFKNNTINVDKSYDYAVTKKVKATKTKNSVRKIYVPEKVMSILKAKKKYAKDEFVFDRVNNQAVRDVLKLACKRAGINRHIRFHTLRHTHSSILIADGVNPVAVSKRLGHSSPQITMTTYAHVIKELEDSENDKIKDIFE